MIVPKDAPSRSVARPLHNLGSTCFVNCVLQALAHAPELCLAMDTESHSSACPVAAENAAKRRLSPTSSPDDDPTRRSGTRKSKRYSGGGSSNGGRKSPSSDDSTDGDLKYCALCELEHHVRSVHDAAKKDKPFAPSTFVNGFIEHVAPWFKLGVQEDAHEFLRLLIDAMQKSCLQARVQDNPQDDPPTTSVPAISNENDKEYPFSLFRGTVESKVNCEACNATSATLDPIEDIGLEVSLDAPSNQTNDRPSRNSSPLMSPALADVQSAFQRFAREEKLDGYKCEKCGCKGRATKQSRLSSIPPILTLHLKRFRYGDSRPTVAVPPVGRRSGRSEVNQLMGSNQDFLLGGKTGSAKIEGHIKFDVCFDLKPYLTQELQSKEKSMFCRLFAVIVHAGKNSHSGHYIAYVQSLEKNEWWKMDDGRVTLAHTSDVLQAEAYMLFYRVLQHPLTIALEETYKLKLENSHNSINNQGSQNSSKAAAATNDPENSSSNNSKKRRRSLEVFATGEDWARAKAPRLVGVARYAQEVAAEALQLSSDLLKAIRDEATTTSHNATTKKSVPSKMATEHDLADEGAAQLMRRKLCDLFYRLAQHYDDGSIRRSNNTDNNGASDTTTNNKALSFFEGPPGGAPTTATTRRHKALTLRSTSNNSNASTNSGGGSSSRISNTKSTAAAPGKKVEPIPGVVEPDHATDVL